MTRRNLSGRRVVITGASTGIGRALAVELARHGARLVLNARSPDKLQAAADEVARLGAACETVIGDVAEDGVRRAIVDRSQQAFGGLDVLVNNAGIGALGRFDEAESGRLRRVMEVNFFALVELSRLALPLLKQGQQPLVVNVSSILGHRGIPFSSEYCASKFAVRGFSESLRAELAADGVGVLVVCPGTTKTEFFTSVIDRRGTTPWEGGGATSPETVARAMVRAMQRGAHEIVPSFKGRFVVLGERLAPRLLDYIMSRFVPRR
ncbi:MAG TPA: SDR family oxidoreductase [Pirellulales bacterium]|jgi:short-subunit dehydrogenase|nr:SDR family oxidoreductase [Pirellulales bacterium]